MSSFKKNNRRWPKKGQWLWFFKALNRKEKTFFLFCFFLFVASSFFLIFNFYFNNSKVVPAIGGIYREGLVGQPRFINPLYATSDVDRDIIELVYSGLMKYNAKGEIVFDIAENYELQEDGKVYLLSLRDDLFWHDNKPLTADDVVFTVKSIQSPEYKSPFRANWVGVTVEKVDDFKVKFILTKPYVGFLENLTLKILPKHIWSDISPENAPFSSYNFKPVGSGLYKVSEVVQENSRINSLKLEMVKDAYISEIIFSFFDDKKEVEKVDGFGSFQEGKGETYYISMPRYFALFFNLERTEMSKDLRRALNYALDKEKLPGEPVNSPFLPDFYNLARPDDYQYNPEKAKDILEENGFFENERGYREKIIKGEASFVFSRDLSKGSRGEEVTQLQDCLKQFYPEQETTGYFGSQTEKTVVAFQEKYREDILTPSDLTTGTGSVRAGTRTKLNEVCFSTEDEIIPLELSIATLDQRALLETAEKLKEQFEKIGVRVLIEKINEEEIKEREYETFLVGIILSTVLDPLPFWHSGQKNDPGYNLSMYENKKVDELLEEIRVISDDDLRREKIEEVQEIILADFPALFLYTQGYVYNISEKIKGVAFEKIIHPSHRFSEIQDWYIKTKRIWRRDI